jgi:hypothetical protein
VREILIAHREEEKSMEQDLLEDFGVDGRLISKRALERV